MRNVMTMFLLSIFFLGCDNSADINDSTKRNENWCWFVDKNTGKGEWVPIGDETTLEDGDYTLFFCNGAIRKKGKLKDQKDCDTMYYYDLKEVLISKIFQDENGKLQEIMPNGKYKGYYATCELSVEGEFIDNKQVGKRTEYYKNGNIKAQSEVIDGVTWYTTYNEQGQILDSVITINGKLNGLAKYWYPNGQLEAIRYFKDDLRHGDFIFYHNNGQLKQTIKFFNDIPEDTVRDWYDNGQLRFIKQYKNGKKIGSERTWHSNGNIRSIFSFTDDKEHGDYVMYHENGVKQREGKYNMGQKVETWKYYDKDGNLIDTKSF